MRRATTANWGWAAAIIALALGLGAQADATVTYTFTDTNTATIDTGTGSIDVQSQPFDITNGSGTTWTGFRVNLFGWDTLGDPYKFMRFTDVGGDGVIYSGPGSATFTDTNGSGDNDQMQISGLSVANGADLSFSADILGGVSPEGVATYQITGTPTAEASSPPPEGVPEPATLALLGTGILGMGLLRKAKRA